MGTATLFRNLVFFVFAAHAVHVCAQDIDSEYQFQPSVDYRHVRGLGPVILECRVSENGSLACRSDRKLKKVFCYQEGLQQSATVAILDSKLLNQSFSCKISAQNSGLYSSNWVLRLLGEDFSTSDWVAQASNKKQYQNALSAELVYRENSKNVFSSWLVSGIGGAIASTGVAAGLVGVEGQLRLVESSQLWGPLSLQLRAQKLMVTGKAPVEYVGILRGVPLQLSDWGLGASAGIGNHALTGQSFSKVRLAPFMEYRFSQRGMMEFGLAVEWMRVQRFGQAIEPYFEWRNFIFGRRWGLSLRSSYINQQFFDSRLVTSTNISGLWATQGAQFALVFGWGRSSF